LILADRRVYLTLGGLLGARILAFLQSILINIRYITIRLINCDILSITLDNNELILTTNIYIMRTVEDVLPSDVDIKDIKYNYNPELTSSLDAIDSDFNQDIINEIVLWKVNRYAKIDDYTLKLINQIKKTDKVVDAALTGDIFLKLLHKDQKGIRLPMASSILRFKNPTIYQIIDQRVYRFLYGVELKYSLNDINSQIVLYLDYLKKLRYYCDIYKVDFKQADRIFYAMDKHFNSDTKLNGY